jgi:hypothetical protein
VSALRTLTCALAALGCITGTAAAQLDDEPARTVVGPMAGMSISTFRGAAVGNADVRTGLIAGGFATFSFSPYFAFEPQVAYVQKGANYTTGSAGGMLGVSYSLTYLEIPLLFKARYPIAGGKWPTIISVVAGPAIGLNTSCNYGSGSSKTKCGTRGILPTVFDPPPTGVDYSAVFGIGLDVWHIALQARYDYSFTQTFNTGDLGPYTPVDIKNQAWEITLGYKFAIK